MTKSLEDMLDAPLPAPDEGPLVLIGDVLTFIEARQDEGLTEVEVNAALSAWLRRQK